MRVFLLDDLAEAFEEGKTALEKNDRVGFMVIVDRLLDGFENFGKGLDEALG